MIITGVKLEWIHDQLLAMYAN